MAVASIKRHNGVPSLFIDGKLYPPIFYFTLFPIKDCIKAFAEAGIHLYSWGWSNIINPHRTWGIDLGWRGPGQYSYDRIDKEIRTILEVDPDAYLLPRVMLSAPHWWLELYPEEMNVYHNGTEEGQCFCSRRWLTEAGEAFQRLIQHIEDTPYGERVIGYVLGGGTAGTEWIYWGYRGYYPQLPDYSKSMVDSFRNRLRSIYKGDVKLLREAWNDPNVTFDSATIPSFNERQSSGQLNLLRDPSKNRPLLDYYFHLGQVVAEAIIHFAELGKKAIDRPLLMGAAYGYLLSGAGFPDCQENWGHQSALRRILSSKVIDFMWSPYGYCDRGPGGVNVPQCPIESIRLHGKLHITEVDARTAPINDLSYNRFNVLTIKESVEVLKRDFAAALTRGTGLWWMEINENAGTFDDPAIMEAISRMNNIAKTEYQQGFSAKHEIAIVIDEESPLFLAHSHNLTLPLIYKQQIIGLARMGAPYDIYLHNDLDHQNIPDYKLYIVLDVFYLSEDERKVLKERLQGNNKTVLWIYAPGFITDQGFSLRAVEELVGMKIAYRKNVYDREGLGSPLYLRVTDFQHPITQGLDSGDVFGTDRSIGPIFYCNDPDVRILGWVFTPAIWFGQDAPGLVVKEYPDWTSIYVAVPNIPPKLLRNIARYAGVHIYSNENDVVFANERIIAIHTRHPGRRNIQLPRRCNVYDAWSGKLLAKDTSRCELDMEKNETYLLRIE